MQSVRQHAEPLIISVQLSQGQGFRQDFASPVAILSVEITFFVKTAVRRSRTKTIPAQIAEVHCLRQPGSVLSAAQEEGRV